MITALAAIVLGSPVQWTVFCNEPTVQVSPSLYGIFFEEINCAGDGGLYAELVRNRSFEDSDKPDFWTLAPGSSGSITLKKGPDRQWLHIDSMKSASVVNSGYWGMSFKQGEPYRFTILGRTPGSGIAATVRLQSASGKTLAQQTVQLTAEWREVTGLLRPVSNDKKGQVRIGLDDAGEADIDFISVLPGQVIREDLFDKLDDLQPAFVRFPGGCWVEGETMDRAQRWKQTIGPLHMRRTQPNIWGYQSTNGLGYHEYLQLCEDLQAAPLFVINCGMSHREVVPLSKMGEFVQDALDAIEYANGPAGSRWGSERAKNGHPLPFNLRYVEIGNENGGPAYEERYALIYKAIKSKYPEIGLIANDWGGVPRQTPVDIVDEHYYNTPDFFFENATKYDRYDRNGPRIYVGEYAVTQGCGNGNLIAALGEAAFMIGMERNSDVVTMSSYAPLFANLNIKAWNPDLIYFDNSRSYGTPSYWVQKLFSTNRPTEVVKSKLVAPIDSGRTFPSGGVGVGTWNTQAEFKDLVVRSGEKVVFQSADGRTLSKESGTWNLSGDSAQQTGGGVKTRLTTGNRPWKNYTLTLKARKISGEEGFLITVGQTGPDDFIWWNIGGWGNTRHALEMSIKGGKGLVGSSVPGSVETGRWYDVKVEYTETRIKCYLDGALVADEVVPQPKRFHGIAGRDSRTGDIVLKLVNGSEEVKAADIELVDFQAAGADATVLTSLESEDENSIEHPLRVSPKGQKVKIDQGRIRYRCPPLSLTIIRVHSKKP